MDKIIDKQNVISSEERIVIKTIQSIGITYPESFFLLLFLRRFLFIIFIPYYMCDHQCCFRSIEFDQYRTIDRLTGLLFNRAEIEIGMIATQQVIDIFVFFVLYDRNPLNVQIDKINR